MQRIKQVQKALKQLGFVYVRKSGSHEIWRCPQTGLFTTIVDHGKKLDKGAINNIWKQVKVIQNVREQKAAK